MHTQDQKKNKQRPFKYQPTCLLFEWRVSAQLGPGREQHAGVTCFGFRPNWGNTAKQTTLVTIFAGIL